MRLVADDYGLAPEIDRAIQTLSQKGLVHSASVMVSRHYEPDLLHPDIDIGAHIDLTSAGSKWPRSPKQVLCDGLLRRLCVSDLMDHMRDQVQQITARGFVVRRLETHQHVHVVPQVLDALIAVAREHKITRIRCLTMAWCHLPYYFFALLRCGFFAQTLKMAALYTSGLWMKYKLDRAGLRYCPNLVLMPLAQGGNYSRLLGLLMGYFEKENAEMVVHPGTSGLNLAQEPYVAGRDIEYAALLALGKTPCGTAFTNT